MIEPFSKTTNQSTYLSLNGFAVLPAESFPVPDIDNQTLTLFSMTARLATDSMFCYTS